LLRGYDDDARGQPAPVDKQYMSLPFATHIRFSVRLQ
jgi:hypothetical protein